MSKIAVLVFALMATWMALAVGLLDLLDTSVGKEKKDAAPVAVTNAVPVAPAVAAVTNAPAVEAKPVKKSAKRALTGRPAKITADSVIYDRKEGMAVFDRNVHVDDEQYQLHADKVYVFMADTNDIKRVVAIGHVAMTNDTKRAYGAKVSYFRQSGMVVLYSGDGVTAEVRDEAKSGEQSVTGGKIKFWIDSEQVEVTDVTITAPKGGMKAEDLKKALR